MEYEKAHLNNPKMRLKKVRPRMTSKKRQTDLHVESLEMNFRLFFHNSRFIQTFFSFFTSNLICEWSWQYVCTKKLHTTLGWPCFGPYVLGHATSARETNIVGWPRKKSFRYTCTFKKSLTYVIRKVSFGSKRKRGFCIFHRML